MANLTTRDKYLIYQTLCQANSLKFVIKLYIEIIKTYGSNMLSITKLILIRAASLQS